jgi:membrane-associated phospholipid phosphatase
MRRSVDRDQPLLEPPGGRMEGGLEAASYRVALLGLAGVLAVAGGLAFRIDIPVAAWCKAHRLPGEMLRLLNFAEICGHALGVAVLLAAALVLDRTLRPWVAGAGRAAGRNLFRLVAAAYSGGLVVDLLKASVIRVRPRAADLSTLASAFGTFGDAALAVPTQRGADVMSFPSGHAAVAAGFAAAMGWKYPEARPFFAVLAACAAAQRVVSSAHYPSDVAFGAAIGLLGAVACLGSMPSKGGKMVRS